MLKYADTEVTFAEVPDEISLCINITNCPCHCPGCHSTWLWEDDGIVLNEESLSKLIEDNPGITCVAFMGGDREPERVKELAGYVHNKFYLHTAWYSGTYNLNYLNRDYMLCLDYVKLGPYDEKCGGLNCTTTNQRMYKRHGDIWDDITSAFFR